MATVLHDIHYRQFSPAQYKATLNNSSPCPTKNTTLKPVLESNCHEHLLPYYIQGFELNSGFGK